MAEQQERPPVLPYQPAERTDVPLARRMVVWFLRMLPWFGIYAVMLVCVLILVLGRVFGRDDQPFTFGALLADLFIAWLVFGLCMTVYRFFRKRK